MAVGVFENCVFFLKVNHLSAQEKKRLKACIQDNGGIISFVLNQQCTHIIAENADALTTRHLQNIKKNGILIVDVDFVLKSGNKMTKSCEIDPEKRTTLNEKTPKKEARIQDKINKQIPQETTIEENNKSKNERVFIECGPDSVHFQQDFEVAKYIALERTLANPPNEVAVVELQCLKEHFQIMVHMGLSNGVKKKMQYLQFETPEEACERLQQIVEGLKKKNYKLRSGIPQVAVHLASEKLQEVLLQDAITATSVSQEVGRVVELIWLEALGHLDNILQHPVNKISLNDVSKAEGILLQVRKALDKGENLETLKIIMAEFYLILPHKSRSDVDINKKLLSAKEDLCQVIRDIVSVCETNMSSTNPPSLAKYRALRCMIQHVDPSSAEYIQVKEQLLLRNHSDTPISILNIFRVGRVNEAVEFERNIGNVQALLHASTACNFVGILSRGLLLPKMVVEDYGVERTDIGNLGSGIYFSDSVSTSVKYCRPTQMDGSRLLVVCDVALGDCLEMHKKDFSLTNAPSGYQSVHGIRKASAVFADFEDDEYVVYKTSQVKMKYIVQFCTAEDKIGHFCPDVNVADLEDVLPRPSDLTMQPDEGELIDIKPLEEVKGGLQDSSGNPIPLEGVYIKGKILDLVAQVVVFQKYTNRNTAPIEAKYVFPLDGTAAVCGFEAFINGKHIIGEVKEKEQAHQDYREAVIKGHGAYLMDQDAPDVFTVSVGNLPPNATVLIKITYVTELSISYGSVTFTVPGAVASWQEDKALNENTQDTVEKICVKEEDARKGEFSLDLSVEMPFKINEIWSYCHSVKVKKTDCKAVISTEKDSTLDSSGFTVVIELADANVPRMWVEKHPDKESEACMLVFQPDFTTEDEDPDFNDITICLDCSNSMSSVMKQAKKIAILAVNTLCSYKRLNIIKFGSSYEEFCSSFGKPVSDPKLYEEFIKSAKPTMGNTDFWKPLHSLSLLAPSKGVRNIILISDGHIQDEGRTLQIVKNNVKHTRVFTCGVGSTANRHMLRSLARYGSGAFEYFDAKSKYSWENKIVRQIKRTESPGCNAVSIKWQQFGSNAPVPVQAPAHVQSIFQSERVLIYGFVPHCTQAALRALIREQEIDTMVSTTELQKTTGTILHKLTARALIRDYEDGILHENENEHEMKKHMLKSMIIDLSKEYSIVTQFTSFVAIEKRDADESPAEIPDIQQLIALEDVDILPYMTWEGDADVTEVISRKKKSVTEEEDDMGAAYCIYDDFDMADVSEVEAERKATKKKLKYTEEFATEVSFYDEPFMSEEDENFLQRICLHTICDLPDVLEIETEAKPVEEDWKNRRKAAGTLESTDVYESMLPVGLMHQFEDYSEISPPVEAYHCFSALSTADVQKTLKVSFLAESVMSPISIQADHCFSALSTAAVQEPLEMSFLAESVMPPISRHADHCFSALSTAAVQEPLNLSFLAGSVMPPICRQDRTCSAVSALPTATGQAYSACGGTTSGLFGSSVPRDWTCSAVSALPTATGQAYSAFGGTTSGLFGSSETRDRPCSAVPALPDDSTGQSYSAFGGTTSGLFGSSVTKVMPCSAAPAFAKQISMVLDEPSFGLFGPSVSPLRSEDEPRGGKAAWRRRQALQAQFSDCSTYVVKNSFNSMARFPSPPPPPVPPRFLPPVPVATRPKAFIKASANPSWADLFQLQTLDHYWEPENKLGLQLKVNFTYLIYGFLPGKGLQSLGSKGREAVLRLIATLLVLQALWLSEDLSGICFKSLLKLDESSIKNDYYWRIHKAIEWARKVDAQYPGICSRIQLGRDWNSTTRQLLRIDPLEDNSPLANAVYGP